MIKRILAVMLALVMIFGCMPAPQAQATEIAPTAIGTTYYVSSLNGAEGNNGTSESSPFSSLLKINEITLQPGDRVLLERGSVFVDEYLHIQGSGSAEAPIIIDVYGDEDLPKPLIQTNGYGVWYQDYGKRLDNINHKYRGNVSTCILLYDVEYIEISNIAMTNEGNYAAGEVYNSKSRIDRTGVAGIAENIGTVDHVYLRNLDIRNVEGNVRNKHMANGGIYFLCHQPDSSATGIAKFDDVLIEGCRLDKVNRWGIAVGYTAYWDQFAYGPTIDADVCKTYGSTNVVIRGNYLTEIGGDGITTMYCYQPLMEYNVLDGYCRDMTDAIYGPSDGGLVAAGIWPWMCKTAILQYNEAYDSTPNPDGQAWDADWGDNAIYQYNYSSNNSGGAVMFCGTYACNTVFRYNISQNDLAGVLNLASSPNGEIYNNVFYIKEGVKINRSGMSGGWGNTIYNNIFYYAGSAPADATLGNWGDITAEWRGNLYYNYENIPADPYAITADPLFVDPGKGPSGAQASGLVHDRSVFDGYKLQPGSPAINAGIPIENNGGLDFFGNELDLIPDIGAYEAGTFDSDASKAVLVDVALGETVTISDLTGNFADATPVVDNSKIASVSLTGDSTVIRTRGDAVTTLADGKYILVNNRAGKTMLNLDAASQQGEAASMAGLRLEGTKENISDNAVWTITASGNGYTVQDIDGNYLSIVQNDANLVAQESVVNVVYRNNTWTLSQSGAYLNDAANKAVCASGWNGDGYYDASTDAGSLWTIYPVSEETVSSTQLTFTGLYPGSTGIVVGDTLYLVRVSGQLQEVELEVGETATFQDVTGNYQNADTDALDPEVATVDLAGILTDSYALGSKVTSLTSGGKYILVNTRSGKPVTNIPATAAAAAGAGSGLNLNGAKEDAARAAIWTITSVNGGYTVQDLEGNYMTVGSNAAGTTAQSTVMSLNYGGSTWTIACNGAYLNHFGGGGSTCAAGWQDTSAAGDAGSQWDIYQVNTTTAENGTEITFTAVGNGETHVQIGQVMYHITVTGGVCTHTNTELRGVIPATCLSEGYTGDTWCLDCETMIASGTVTAIGDHSFDNGICAHCGEYEAAKLVNGVYEIGNAGQLYWFAKLVDGGTLDASAVLTANITVNEDVLLDGELNEDADLRNWNAIGANAKKFGGTFDGRGFTVSGLYYDNDKTTGGYIGLFASISENAVVKNVTVADSYLCGYRYIGAIVGQNVGGTIENCANDGSVVTGSGSYIGGIVGGSSGTVTGCHSSGVISSEEGNNIGGIVGSNTGIVELSYNTGAVMSQCCSDEHCVGGIAGENLGTIRNCYNTGAVSNKGSASGGIAGKADGGIIENCHNVGAVSAKQNAGGIIGKAYNNPSVINCFSLDDTDAAVFASGEITYLLNGSTSEGELIWKQTLGSDAYPKFEGAVVYYNGSYSNSNVCAHTPGEAVRENENAPSCTEDGSYESVISCTVCGEELSRETVTVPATGHDWQDGTCGNCGETQPKPVVNPFIDVKQGDFYYDAVMWAVENGIAAGTTTTTFSPNGELLRAQFVTFLWRAAGEPEPTSTYNPFVDVKQGDYFYKAVLWAVEKGITAGVAANRFAPNGITTRAQAVCFLWRYLGQPDAPATNKFTDVKAGEWYADAIYWAVNAGVTSGMSANIFGINEICNRAQAVTFLYRALAK